MITNKELVRQLAEEIKEIISDCTRYATDCDECDHFNEDKASDRISKEILIKFGAKMFEEGYEQCCKDNGLHYSQDDPDVFGAMTECGLIAEKEEEDEKGE